MTSADRRPTIGRSSADSQNCRPMEKNYNKVVIIYFLSADEKRAKIWLYRPTVGGDNVIAVLVLDLVENPEDRFSHNEAHLVPKGASAPTLEHVLNPGLPGPGVPIVYLKIFLVKVKQVTLVFKR